LLPGRKSLSAFLKDGMKVLRTKLSLLFKKKNPNFYYDANPDLDTDPDPDWHKNYADPQNKVSKL
jgi:hypothetical protein